MNNDLKNERGFAISALIPIIISVIMFLFILPILWQVFGFEPVKLPDELVDFVGKIKYLVYMVAYFIPIEFILGCIIIILLARNANIFFSLINFIMRKLGGN